MNTFVLKTDILGEQLGEDLFFQLCAEHRDLRFERNHKREILIMAPTGSETGRYNFRIYLPLGIWNEKHNLGVPFDSSTGFTLPNGAIRSPDFSWIPHDKWNNLSKTQQEKFAPICPDFVIELRSASDGLKPLQEKMEEYIHNGSRLGWLIDLRNQKVYVYEEQKDADSPCLTSIVEDFDTKLSGGTVLPDFEFDLKALK